MKPTPGKVARLALIACAAGLFFASGAWAMKNDARVPNASELSLLPPYCPHTQIISRHLGRQQSMVKYDAQTKPYVDLYGADFWHMHHYCFGLTAAMRANRQANRSERQRELLESINQYDYVIQRVGQGSVILPELHLQKGLSLIRLDRGNEGALQLKKAIELNPAYTRAYIELSDYYLDSKRKDLAIKVLEDGLSASPEALSLQRRYADLGGTRTFEKPAAPPQEAAADKPETIQAEPAPTASEPATPPGQIGSPTNPYCRFCP